MGHCGAASLFFRLFAPGMQGTFFFTAAVKYKKLNIYIQCANPSCEKDRNSLVISYNIIIDTCWIRCCQGVGHTDCCRLRVMSRLWSDIPYLVAHGASAAGWSFILCNVSVIVGVLRYRCTSDVLRNL